MRFLHVVSAALLVTGLAPLARADETEQERLASEETVALLAQPAESNISRRDTGTLVFGIVLASAGGASLFSGLALGISRSGKAHAPSYDDGAALPIALAVSGALVGAASIPLIVYGARHGPQTALRVGPGAIEMRGSF